MWGHSAVTETARRISREIYERGFAPRRMWGGLSMSIDVPQQNIFMQPAIMPPPITSVQPLAVEWGMNLLALTGGNLLAITSSGSSGTPVNHEAAALARQTAETEAQAEKLKEEKKSKEAKEELKRMERDMQDVEAEAKRNELNDAKAKVKRLKQIAEEEAEHEEEMRRKKRAEDIRKAEARRKEREDEEYQADQDRILERERKADNKRDKQRREDMRRRAERDDKLARESRERDKRAAENRRARQDRRDRHKDDREERDRRDAATEQKHEQRSIEAKERSYKTEEDRDHTIDLYYYIGLNWNDTHTQDEIKAAAIKSLRDHHPNKVANMTVDQQKRSAVRVREVNIARRVLEDVDRRQAYDEKHIISDGAFEYWKQDRSALQTFRSRERSRERSGSTRG
jgi:hypothetical protein